MSYISKTMIKSALTRMKQFESDLASVHSKYGYNLRKNLGRRNALVSQSQEKEVASALRTVYKDVVEDGTPGKPDILIVDLGRELECKLTSGHGKSKTMSLQTDYETLRKKGSLDYLYIITNEDFNKFCALHFVGLTIDNFHKPANGSRGKARMDKTTAMLKATALHGTFEKVNDRMVRNYQDKINKAESDCNDEISTKLVSLLERNVNTKEAERLVKNIEFRYEKKIKAINEKISHWKNTPARYTFNLKPC